MLQRAYGNYTLQNDVNMNKAHCLMRMFYNFAVNRSAYAARVDLLRAAARRDAAAGARERRARQQSRVPFEALALDPTAQMESPPNTLARRPYWVMRLLRLTVTQGGYLSPRLFIPKVCKG